MQLMALALSFAEDRAGRSNAARIAIIAMTTRSSMRVKAVERRAGMPPFGFRISDLDRKSTRLNSSHLVISYAVFCLKKKISLCISVAASLLYNLGTRLYVLRPRRAQHRQLSDADGLATTDVRGVGDCVADGSATMTLTCGLE